MPTIIAHHRIKDHAHWLASPKRRELFGSIGVTEIKTFVDPSNPTHVGVMMNVPDMEAFSAIMKSEAGAAAMEHDGVVPESVVVLIEAP